VKSRLLKATGLAASFLALFSMLGGHWLALQSVAWARMLAEYSRNGSFSEAVEKTFDGKHPCKMCLGIREGRQQEEREQRQLPLVKTEKAPELFCDLRRVAVPLAPLGAEDVVAMVPKLHPDFIDSPPSPPPRLFAVR
jgi:hypothetical protein